eukprot:7355126-Pyramimonas_sp.AAC.2
MAHKVGPDLHRVTEEPEAVVPRAGVVLVHKREGVEHHRGRAGLVDVAHLACGGTISFKSSLPGKRVARCV